MLELAILLSLVALCLAALSVIGFAAALAAGVGMILVLIFVDWLRHHTATVRGWLHSRFGERLRPVLDARAEILLMLSLCGFLGWLAYLWYRCPRPSPDPRSQPRSEARARIGLTRAGARRARRYSITTGISEITMIARITMWKLRFTVGIWPNQ